MRKCFCVAWIVLCGVAVIGCHRETLGDLPETCQEEASGRSSETMPLDDRFRETADSCPGGIAAAPGGTQADTGPADSSDERETIPTTIGAYLSVAEELWEIDSDGIFWMSELIKQGQEDVNLDKEFDAELILAEDFAKTGGFTLTLSVDETPDNLYVLDGMNGEYSSIVFGGNYLLGDTLFLGVGSGEHPPYILDLETKTLTACQKESETVQNLFSDWLQGQPEGIRQRVSPICPTAYIDDCIIYRAAISEYMDTEKVAAIFAAFDESHSLRAYLFLGAENILSGWTEISE